MGNSSANDYFFKVSLICLGIILFCTLTILMRTPSPFTKEAAETYEKLTAN